MDYLDFKRDFCKGRAKLKLPPGCTEAKPPTMTPTGLYVWTLEWQFVFNDDNRYMRIREHYSKVKGLELSHRSGFAFHYGPIVRQDKDGLPIRDDKDPVDIRIDNSSGRAHMHYQAPDPHHLQESVEGINLERLDMFTFIRAILQHRKSGKPIDQSLRFRIR